MDSTHVERLRVAAAVIASAGVLLFLLCGCGGAGGGPCRVLTTDHSVCVSRLGLYAIWGVAVDPLHPQTLYVHDDNTVLQSTDGGSSWSRLDPWGPWGINEVDLDPRRPDTVYVSTEVGIYRSTDGGSSWTRSLKSLWVSSIAFTPQGGVLYASVANCSQCSYHGPPYFRSTDGGASWKVLHGRLPRLAFAVFDPYHTHWHHFDVDVAGYTGDTGSLAFSRHAAYAAGNDGVYEKLNTGRTWRLVARGQNFASFAVSANGRVIYAGTDGGMTASGDMFSSLYRFRLSRRGLRGVGSAHE
jgi:photosystem II stability/assembly factor-like uncharacterized protein